ncbi:MAG TPA: leucyl aminopeptidase, partial [Nocardioidaceae bacterium]|nr:leucyl aminopeptidase [Nocardioidaceae bacterium]
GGRDGHTLTLAAGAGDIDGALHGRLVRLLTVLGATGKAGQITRVPSTERGLAAPLVVAVGLGKAPNGRQSRHGRDGSSYDVEVLRRGAGAAVRALAGTGKVALALPASTVAEVAAVAEGALLGAYAFDRYRSANGEGPKAPVASLRLVSPIGRDRAAKAAVSRASALARAVHLVRDLVNTPPSDLHPAELADAAQAVAAKSSAITVTVLEERALRRGGYGGLIGVGQGSANPPRLVKLTYRHPKATQHLALVGKGITFDSGGLSLKPSASMVTMKCDMAGAAAVIATVGAVAELGLPVNVTGWAACAENMPSGSAQRPSDVITIYGGRTVEVLNTDAEGRLVLADALVAASGEQPDVIVDVATLTGAQMVALGGRTSAIMSNDDELRAQVHDAAQRAGEAMWPMPLPEELRATLDSPVADLANMGDRFGGMLVAGLFLKEFVGEGLRWAHLDIAGPAYNSGEPHDYTPRGGTGVAVRTMLTLAEDLAAS